MKNCEMQFGYHLVHTLFGHKCGQGFVFTYALTTLQARFRFACRGLCVSQRVVKELQEEAVGALIQATTSPYCMETFVQLPTGVPQRFFASLRPVGYVCIFSSIFGFGFKRCGNTERLSEGRGGVKLQM